MFALDFGNSQKVLLRETAMRRRCTLIKCVSYLQVCLLASKSQADLELVFLDATRANRKTGPNIRKVVFQGVRILAKKDAGVRFQKAEWSNESPMVWNSGGTIMKHLQRSRIPAAQQLDVFTQETSKHGDLIQVVGTGCSDCSFVEFPRIRRFSGAPPHTTRSVAKKEDRCPTKREALASLMGSPSSLPERHEEECLLRVRKREHSMTNIHY